MREYSQGGRRKHTRLATALACKAELRVHTARGWNKRGRGYFVLRTKESHGSMYNGGLKVAW
ncbi:hypothetical protein C8Q73DRAFT_680240 [Cubamyces lactineus]|nr:hypothetical protein C8Q73DRAFT_680240 [Cubamyces lactineus]